MVEMVKLTLPFLTSLHRKPQKEFLIDEYKLSKSLIFPVQLKLEGFLWDLEKHPHLWSGIPIEGKSFCFWICTLLWTYLDSTVLEWNFWDSCTSFPICQWIQRQFQPFLDFSTLIWSSWKSNLHSIFHPLYATYNFPVLNSQETERKSSISTCHLP